MTLVALVRYRAGQFFEINCVEINYGSNIDQKDYGAMEVTLVKSSGTPDKVHLLPAIGGDTQRFRVLKPGKATESGIASTRGVAVPS